MSEQGRAAEGPQVEVAGKAAGGDYSPDAGETARAMTANAVVSAVANVPLLLAAVALVVGSSRFSAETRNKSAGWLWPQVSA